MQALEVEITQLQETLADTALYVRNPEQFDTLSKRFTAATQELSTAETRWLELEALQEEIASA